VILHIHAPDFDTFLKNSNYIVSILIKHTLNSCDAIIVLSNYWKRVISEVVNESSSVFIIPNAADISSLEESKIQSRKRLNIPDKKKVLFSLGNLEERKGYSYLIESMSTICKERDDVYCVIGGSGPIKSSLESKVKELNLNGYIKFVGFIQDNELKFWFNACDFFVLPSLAEGSPIVMFEALSFGKPFIGTAVGGIPDIIISDDYGSLVEAGNSKDLSQKILYALNKDWNSEHIKRYSKQFNWASICKKVAENVYLKLV
jgi:Glycosyltransferase